jgi:hypothetical protein
MSLNAKATQITRRVQDRAIAAQLPASAESAGGGEAEGGIDNEGHRSGERRPRAKSHPTPRRRGEKVYETEPVAAWMRFSGRLPITRPTSPTVVAIFRSLP